MNSGDERRRNMTRRRDVEIELDPAMEQTLRDFRASVQAWSAAELVRPRTLRPARRGLWRLAAGWALCLLVAVGALSGGALWRRQVAVRQAEAAAAQKLRVEAEQRAQYDELLAAVDSDLSRQAPRAMEPLAKLMGEEDSQ